ncbi:EF-hand domain-containing protein [Polaromonas sp. JS666]|uniref:EF-hand domain-containing protein n=1 Tax=Polaromonas sp. (strain JS666 / ATCC BAA-500) TaxID=296591 RepID=UPI0015874697|nr:EF-hand domain-containing protein [Polaromonas sp. JS666]
MTYSRRKPMKQPTTKTLPIRAPSSPARPRMVMLGSLLALAAAAALLAAQAQAQTAEPAAAASAPAVAAPAVAKYDPKDLERAFKFMDKNGDGKVSRDEASNFRGVSKHFDEADLNKDNFLSREEFDNAMNQSRQP